jgi:Kef-type K+ transport system membrane component KefB
MFLGVLSVATSVGITARILSEKRQMDSAEGVTILSAAVIDDVLGIIILAIVVGISR